MADVMLLERDQTPHEYGGRLCLGFANSILWRRSDSPIDQLDSYADVVTCVARAGSLESAQGLLALAEAHPRRAKSSFAAAVELREVLFGLFSDVAAATAPEPSAMKVLNDALAESLTHVSVRETADGSFTADWQPAAHLDLPIWQVAASAGAVLTSADRDRLKQCPGEQCGWLFLDESSSQTRRWCDSRLCGNRARVRAHYLRSRAAG